MVVANLAWPSHWILLIGSFTSTFGAALQCLCSMYFLSISGKFEIHLRVYHHCYHHLFYHYIIIVIIITSLLYYFRYHLFCHYIIILSSLLVSIYYRCHLYHCIVIVFIIILLSLSSSLLLLPSFQYTFSQLYSGV